MSETADVVPEIRTTTHRNHPGSLFFSTLLSHCWQFNLACNHKLILHWWHFPRHAPPWSLFLSSDFVVFYFWFSPLLQLMANLQCMSFLWSCGKVQKFYLSIWQNAQCCKTVATSWTLKVLSVQLLYLIVVSSSYTIHMPSCGCALDNGVDLDS